MARDVLAVLARVRAAAVAQARRELAQSRAAEQAQADRLEAHRREIADEQACTSIDTLDSFTEWLPHARGRLAQTQSALAACEAKVGAGQRLLAYRRVEAEAVAKIAERRRAREDLVLRRKDQAAMDEVAGRTERRD